MSRTNRNKITNHRKRQGNTYGLCYCTQCKYGREGGKDDSVMRMKRRWRHAWKLNKEFIKGIYTD